MEVPNLGQLKQTLIIKTSAIGGSDSQRFWHYLRPTRLKLSCLILCLIIACVLYVIHTNTRVVTNSTTSGLTSSATMALNEDDVIWRNLTGDGSMNRLHYEHLQRRFPQCVIIGVRKAGTRVLLSLLDMHPDVVAAHKEVHFFDREENYARGPEWYRQQMPLTLPDQLTIEKTPGYFHTPEVPERMNDLMSKTRLLVIVRDPVVRAISDWHQLDLKAQSHGHPSIPFERLAMYSNGQVNANYTVLQRSQYNVHLKRWLNYFSPRRIHIVDGDVFQMDPYSELVQIEEFLKLPKYYSRDLFYFNATKGFFCRHMPDGVDKCYGEGKGRKHPDVDPYVIKKLRKYFRRQNEFFYKTSSRHFNWNDLVDEGQRDNDSEEERDRKEENRRERRDDEKELEGRRERKRERRRRERMNGENDSREKRERRRERRRKEKFRINDW